MWMEIGAVGAIGVLAYQSLALHYERRALRRARTWYEDSTPKGWEANRGYTLADGDHHVRATQMCGGCGAYLTEEEITKCPGKTCSRFVEGELQSIFPSDTNQIPSIGG